MEWNKPPPMLLWVQADDSALAARLLEELEGGKLEKAYVLLTCDTGAVDELEELGDLEFK